MLVLNPSPARINSDTTLIPPRDIGRGQSVASTGIIGTVTYHDGGIWVGALLITSTTPPPLIIDFSYDQLDRPQVIWQNQDSSGYLYFYDGTLPGYRTLSLGQLSHPAIHNDYILAGTNTIAAYLRTNVLYCRLQSDRYVTEYVWHAGPFEGIQAMGISPVNNSIQVVVW